MLNNRVHLGEVQSSDLLRASSLSSLGIIAGMGEAWGFWAKNRGKFPRNRASADTFSVLGRCCALTDRFNIAENQARIRSNRTKDGSRADPLLIAATTAALSQRQQIVAPGH